jgi:hypothetical protein
VSVHRAVAATKEMRVHSEKLPADAAECERIRVSVTDPEKRELFTRLAQHLRVLAAEIESAMVRRGDKEV